jgi:hypothetical protein
LFEARSADRQQSFGALEQQFWEEARRHYAYAWERLDEAEQKSLAALADVENGAVESAMFCRLRRQALVAGEPTSARLVSASWRRFIGEQVTSSPARVSAESETNRSTFSCADFELRIEQIDSQACRVLVMNSPAGQDAETCKLPFDLGQVGETIRDLERQIWRDAQVDTQGNTSPRAMGRALFHSVFSGAVSQLFFESLGAARSRGQGLRVKIHVDLDESPGLAALPWEFLYIDRRRQFLGLNQHTPIVRFLDVPRQPGAFPIGSSLRVLVALSSPAGEPEICVEQERESMLRAWGKSRRVSVEFLDPATPSALRKELERWQPHILHFTGHGCFEPATGAGMLLFENECGEQAPITGEQLQVLLSNAPSVRLAFLSACQSARSARSSDLDPFSGVAAALVMAGLPAVVAMQFPISTRAALVFGQEFYSRLAAGEPVDAAVASARRALHLEMASSFEWGTPALFMHVSDGRLFEMT